MKLTYYRIIEERDDDDYTRYRVQVKGWFGWKDIKTILYSTHIASPPLTIILRFRTLEEARTYINDKRARKESKKTVLETYAIYG